MKYKLFQPNLFDKIVQAFKKPIQLKELEKIPKSQWAKIYCELNRWCMPLELIHIKPTWWVEELINEKKSKFMRPIMYKITSTIDDKIISQEWNKDNMTREQFELFYQHKDDMDYFEMWMPKIFPSQYNKA